LDEIISVKSYKQEEESNLYEKFKKHLSEVEPAYSVNDYKKYLVDSLIVDPSSYYTFLDQEVEEELTKEIVNALYSTVIEAYPHFEFEFICNEINNGIAFDQMRSFFRKQAETLIGTQPKEKKGITSFADIVKLANSLNKNVIGQQEAAEKTLDAIKLMVANIDSFSSLFYIGPTGVGKTKLAKVLGKGYSGNFLKVNCGEYSSAHDYAKLIGAPPGYVGHSDSSLLGEKAAISNAWVILFDEIEKANSKFYDFLLSLLDDGTCTDNLGNVLDFSQSIFIFTTNEGIQANRLGETRVGFGKDPITYEENKDEIMKSIKKSFNPEFLNRIDHFIFFNQLKDNDLSKIVKLEMNHLPIRKTKPLISYIIRNSNHEEYGARNISKFIKNTIATKIADAILKKKVPLGNTKYYTFSIKNEEVYISNIEEDTDGWTNQKTSQHS
jgi:ATP-dependent Clp protease ATP-binding subunit ClpC